MSNQEKKLFLLDALALIYRAHFAFSKNPRINSKGMNTGAVLGFTNTLVDVLTRESPGYIAVAYDTHAPTFRHVQYPEYKAQREKQPEDIEVAIPITKDIVRAFDIPVLEMEGFEADDIIGTLAKKAARAGFTVYMMTPDKDYAQLVEEKILLYKPAYMGNAIDILGVEEVCKKFDITHAMQVCDILGLQGDASDNIPGIPGFGAKTASKLIKEFGSVEALVENAEKLTGKQQQLVKDFGQQGILSKELATIKIDVPVDFDEKIFCYEGPTREKLVPLFEQLEFRTLAKRVFGEENKPTGGQLGIFDGAPSAAENHESLPLSNKKNITTVKHNYQLVDTIEKRQELIKNLGKQKEFCFDTETTSLDALEAQLVGLAFSFQPYEAYYVPIPENFEEAQQIVNEFKPLLEKPEVLKIGQNLKYDILVLKKYDITVVPPFFDTMMAHYLIDPETRHNMDVMAENYLNYTPVSIESLIGKKGAKQGNMRDVEPEKVAEYAGEDADITLQLKNVFAKQLNELQLEKLYFEVEAPLIDVLATVEYEGVKVDTQSLSDISSALATDIISLEKEIYEMAGEAFNIASPKQLGEILFDKLQLEKDPKKTKSGQYATGEEILSRMANEHEIARKILDFRELLKLKNTYVDTLPKLISPRDGRIHTSYNQAVAATGRLSSTNPNLQNIPIRTEKGREIRKAFVPRNEDFLLMSADYSQVELRIMASFAKDESMIEAFKAGRDIHATTASKIFNVPLEQVDSDMRRKAKTANFGIIYGVSSFGLSQQLNIPRSEASEIIKAYFKEFSAVKEYMDRVIEEARKQEYVETILGRRRYLRDINSRNNTLRGWAERNAINAPIQGTAADIIKVAMIHIQQWLTAEKLQSRMIMQVHDELVFDVHKNEQDIMQEKVADFMKNALPLDVPMEVGIGMGANWLEAH
jgi:DNA polymerase I